MRACSASGGNGNGNGHADEDDVPPAPPPPATAGDNLIGDSTAIRELRATIARIKHSGGDCRYVVGDVQDEPAVRAALADVRAAWGPITGIVHGAGVLADRFLLDKTEEQFRRVFDTKVLGLRVLLGATREDPIDTIVLFSSVAARCGNQGQCDYAMANEVLNKVGALERAGLTEILYPPCGPEIPRELEAFAEMARP